MLVKKFSFIFIIFFLFAILFEYQTCIASPTGQMQTDVPATAHENGTYKVIKVIDGDTVYLDFNKDGYAQKEDTPFQHIRKRFHCNGFASTTETGSQASQMLDCSLCQKVRINGIDTFEVKPSKFLDYQMQTLGLTQQEALGLGYLGKEFAKKNLLNKYVKAEYTADKKFCDMGRPLMSVWYDNDNLVARLQQRESERTHSRVKRRCGIYDNKSLQPSLTIRDYQKELLKAGLAIVYKDSNLAKDLYPYENLTKIKENAKKTHRLNLVLLNKKNGKYHKPDCEYGIKSSHLELIKKPLIRYQGAGCCFEVKKKDKKRWDIEKPIPDIHTSHIDIYFIRSSRYKRPAKNARTAGAQSLLKDLQNAQSIEFAIYGIGGQPEIFDSIVKAKKKGKFVRGVTDMDRYNKNEYSDTEALIKALGSETLKTDFAFTKIEEENRDKYLKEHWGLISEQEYKGFTEKAKYYIDSKKIDMTTTSKNLLLVQKGIMHNKFFVIDKKIVWTGSTNISSSGTGGYNTNVMARIDDKRIAKLYLEEIDQMHTYERFHRAKQMIRDNENIRIDDETVVSAYFLPKNKPVERAIRPLLQSAQKRIYIPMFYLTHNDIVQDLIDAKQKRNIDVAIILDASGAQNLYTKHKLMRQAGIPVYVENWGGKMHMKSAIIDDAFILGSMNWTKSGTTNNDENLMVIYNKEIADKSAQFFLKLVKELPTKCLTSDPRPESPDSINSCNDGMDNDHDGLTDKESPYCKNYHRWHI